MTSQKYPTAEYKTNKLTNLDGVSFLPVLEGEAKGRKAIFFEHAKGKAYIKGDWKLVQKTNSEEWELYHIATDKNESRNVASAHTDRVAELKNAWEDWYATMQPYGHAVGGTLKK
ncbi:MAG: hypothetical protein R2822_15020 [Spirosomataceae bacterium]